MGRAEGERKNERTNVDVSLRTNVDLPDSRDTSASTATTTTTTPTDGRGGNGGGGCC